MDELGHRIQEALKFGLLIKSTCINSTWNAFTTPNEEHAMDTMTRRSQEQLMNTEKDFHAITTTKVGRRIFNFCFLDGGKVGAVFLWEMLFSPLYTVSHKCICNCYFDIHGACREQRT